MKPISSNVSETTPPPFSLLRLSDRNLGIAMFAAAALISLVASVYLFLSGDRMAGIFVGIWVPSILAFGTLLSGVEAQ
jgi:hypothetical protein